MSYDSDNEKTIIAQQQTTPRFVKKDELQDFEHTTIQTTQETKTRIPALDTPPTVAAVVTTSKQTPVLEKPTPAPEKEMQAADEAPRRLKFSLPPMKVMAGGLMIVFFLGLVGLGLKNYLSSDDPQQIETEKKVRGDPAPRQQASAIPVRLNQAQRQLASEFLGQLKNNIEQNRDSVQAQ